MKVQLKLKNKVYENYLIDENGIIYDLNGNIQQTYQNQGRDFFKSGKVYELVMHSFIGYKEDMDIHHINKNKNDNRLCNLIYLSHSEHARLHFGEHGPNKGKKFSKEWREKLSESHKGYKMPQAERDKRKGIAPANKGQIWVNNGIINKMVCPDQIPEGFSKGMLRKTINIS